MGTSRRRCSRIARHYRYAGSAPEVARAAGNVQDVFPQFGKALLLVDAAACVGEDDQKTYAYESVMLGTVGIDDVFVYHVRGQFGGVLRRGCSQNSQFARTPLLLWHASHA